MTARDELDAAMTEKEWQAQVVKLAKDEGWMAYHTYDSRRSEAGWVDLVLVRGPMLLLLELKTESGKVTDAQQAWIDALKKVRIVHADIARPRHWDDVRRALTERAR